MENQETPSTYQQLRTDILEGNIEPESKLSIAVLANRYGSSAAPVREALSRLAAEGLVTRRGQRGYWAAPISADEFVEVSRLREMLEVDAFKQSIKLGDLDWEAAIAGARHRELAVKSQSAGQEDDQVLARTRENRRFHMALISACPSEWQLRFISTLYDQGERFRRLALTSQPLNKPSGKDEHEELMNAAFARDIKTATELLRLHIRSSNEKVMNTLFPER
ncbi:MULTISPECIES: GntR family transcriptional regulator [unclassified Marinobacterium]|uniref:GntR family transcriptional regulator n=1 Tax=unclassified Marinobacterium TaxID=2644139 RepID=UPI001568F296|nr:HTH-type transcriptional repressor CsiR [Marinobacterium sp. xm-g-48]NRP14577.1 HTH-type transcriptional repressor CsiR [Marinobacterium sp. xm-a-152]NRP28095.1 HTH-type transcriptional repressor CsiR [Marinobacterium sp. xm-d-420]NRP56966.1 HTH-type transcriptional repressor CsiR [Marinobacterium sp. xm-d-510]NRP82677.1 HTH-type transcriptional repressor CsiR [Marinobacterium sp. xm-d-509]NRP97784.1 HTH-type transcriptional repressor CsiR [Marinobacterium sp. xm-a-127]